ncbi:MAG: hypothetical protein ACOY4T_10240 [Pseudomonadota bacterium]
MMGPTRQARQFYRMQAEAPAAVAAAAHCLSVPQDWAWRLSGVAVSEFSTLGAQSHFWNVATGTWSPIVARMGWVRLLARPSRRSRPSAPSARRSRGAAACRRVCPSSPAATTAA